jgi:hypothetical protein
VAIEIVLVAFSVGGDVEGLDVVAERDERALGIRAGDADEILGLGEWQRAKKNVIDETEDGGVGADAERESQGGDEGERGRLAEDAKGIAQVLEKSFEERERALVADAFLGLLEATKLEEGLTTGFVGRKAAADIVVAVELEVGGEFGVEFPFEAGATEKVAEASDERSKSGHGSSAPMGNQEEDSTIPMGKQ